MHGGGKTTGARLGAGGGRKAGLCAWYGWGKEEKEKEKKGKT
jgi:hypothetical protein